MKRSIQLVTLALTTTMLLAAARAVSGEDTITYVNGPSFPFRSDVEPIDAALDLNGDGTADFSFQLGYFISPTGVLWPLDTNAVIGPPVWGGASAPYFVWGLGTNSTLFQRFSNGSVLPFGALLGSPPPTNSIWSPPDQSTTIATLFIGPPSLSGLYGPLANVGVGYLGVRFYAADGWHHGWVRLRGTLPVSVVDWAYDTRPDVPIQAGDIGSGGASRQFLVAFPDGHTGSLILTGDQLRCELALNGQFASAELTGPGAAHGRRKPMADLGQPLVAKTNYTSFLRDVTVTHGDAKQLLRGAVSVSVDGGALLGRVYPSVRFHGVTAR